jgi:small subunit ribosomal protein S7
MIERLKAEQFDALESKSGALKKKEETHRMAEANKVFAHFRW